MEKVRNKLTPLLCLVFLLLSVSVITVSKTAVNVQAATGFQTVSGKTYYYDSDGTKHTGWLTLDGKKYYFDKTTGVMLTGWAKSTSGYRYFSESDGHMVTGWVKSSDGQRYFDPSTGYMKTGFVKLDGYWHYFYSTTGIMATGWLTNSKGEKRYFTSNAGVMVTGWLTSTAGVKRFFNTSNGKMYVGFKKISGSYYYFKKSGAMATGWITFTNGKRYFSTSTGKMVTGKVTINGKSYTFNTSTGYLQTSSTSTTGAKTIKNYLSQAFQPIGQALYVWGGGWTQSTVKGVPSNWKAWYDSQTNAYNYNNYKDLSATTRVKGLDCSGFVGWACYQVMQTTSGVGSGYTVVSGEVGSEYVGNGWGSIITPSALAAAAYKLQAGDVGFNSGHTFIVVGQCSDKSVVIVHSTPNAGCQLAGTPTPSGNYSSEAVELAKKYMARYAGYTGKYSPGNGATCYYHPSTGNYVGNGEYSFFRWNTSTLSDPEGYRNKTAAQILADIFS